MEIKKFNLDQDFKKVEVYLRERYMQNKNMTSWLPQRFNDLIYRIDEQANDKNKPLSRDFIYLFEDNKVLVACILPDGDAIYISIKNGYESKFKDIVEYAEKNCRQLFQKNENGSIDFLVIANDSDKYKGTTLEKLGYSKDAAMDFDNYVYPQTYEPIINLPSGYRIAYGNEIDDEYMKWSHCDMGFHPEYELDPNFKESMNAYNGRKKSSMYEDSFECMVVTDDNDICSYSFCYIDKESKTAFIEPVSTREKYRHKGIGSAMMNGIIQKCKELGIEKCYVNSYDWRVKFYNSAGFITEDSIGFWHKSI